MTQHPVSTGETSPRPSRWLWPITLIVLASIITLGIVLSTRMTTNAVNHAVDAFLGAFKPTVNSVTVIESAITSIKGGAANGKIQVLTATLDARVEKRKETRILWEELYLGTTTVELRALDNRVQYLLPISGLAASDFHYDAPVRVLRVTVPPPVLDEELVDVQSDPAKIIVKVDAGWASLKSVEGKKLAEEAKAELRGCVIARGKEPFVRDAARESAREVLSTLIQAQLMSSLGDGVRVQVDFKDGQPPG
jgi:hypothetical protein